jgi:hypothetical protein
MEGQSNRTPDPPWSRRWTAKLGLALFLPFPVVFGVFEFSRNVPGAPSWLQWSLVLEIPLSFVGGAGVLLLAVAWITPKRRPSTSGPSRI